MDLDEVHDHVSWLNQINNDWLGAWLGLWQHHALKILLFKDILSINLCYNLLLLCVRVSQGVHRLGLIASFCI